MDRHQPGLATQRLAAIPSTRVAGTFEPVGMHDSFGACMLQGEPPPRTVPLTWQPYLPGRTPPFQWASTSIKRLVWCRRCTAGHADVDTKVAAA